MGGIGSGRHYRFKNVLTTDEARRIDIRFLKKDGSLRPGSGGVIRWFLNGEETNSVSYSVESDCLRLRFMCRQAGGDWIPHVETIHFDYTSCNYGGTRSWFRCPACNRRIAVLYGVGRRYLCRHRHRLPYTSQHESDADRMLRRAWAIRECLGASRNLMEPIFDKPKGMHWRTFNRLVKKERELARNCVRRILGSY